ncbi:MAG: SGNH/GDSL hydrolase family protein [Syntrophales bacterium]|nr:SGNH/GDSL hydrolase family protein [Syntrophales bacterium]MDD5643256.1 SGNH/GDSL hydrolase family protein [Syntrophales bacterium]
MAKNWFERHAKKTIGLIVIVALVAIIFSAEKILKYRNQGFGFNYNLPNRAVRLREYRPTLKLRLMAGITETDYDTLPRKEFLLRIDKDGFIIPSKKHEHAVITLAFIGGSTTECRYVEEEHRFPYLTGVLLEGRLNTKINSFNAARSGNHSLHSLNVLLNKVLPLKPNIVVMMHNINDLTILLYDKSYWKLNSARPVIFDINQEILANCFKIIRDRWIPNLAMALHNFDRSLRLWRKPKKEVKEEDEFAKIRGKKLEVDQEAMVNEFSMNLQAFIDLCKARHITPVLMTMASRLTDKPDKIIEHNVKITSLSYAQFKGLFEAFNETIRRKARENQVQVIDLAKEVPQTREYLYDLVHYNDQGAIKAAEIISEELTPLARQKLTKN